LPQEQGAFADISGNVTYLAERDSFADATFPGPEEFRRKLVDELRESLLKKGESLPLRNHAALSRIVTLCRDPDVSARGIAVEAARDEAFAALLLRVANSAHSAAASRIGSLTHAVARLGFAFVESLAIRAMAGPAPGTISGAPAASASSQRDIHRHAVRTGLVARSLAPDGIDEELVLMAGLLHNLGLSVMALFAPKAYRSVIAAAERGEQLGPVETETVGFTHAELGSLLVERWAYPPALVNAIRDHDSIEPAGQLASLIKVADLAVRAVGIGIEPPLPLDPETARSAGVDLRVLADRVAPLLEAQERLEQRMTEELEHFTA
jgi:HD-like signal output (HDOD) protein